MAEQHLTPPTPAIKTPAESHAQTVDRFNNNWSMRVSALKGIKGIDLNTHVKPIWQDDMNRVKQGKRPYTNAQVLDFITALQRKTAVAKKQSSGHGGLFGFIGNAASDVGSIAQGLNPVNLVPALYKGALGADAFTMRVAGDVFGMEKVKGYGNTGLTNILNDVQSWVPGYNEAAKSVDKTIQGLNQKGDKTDLAGKVKLAGEGLRTIRGINLIPGAWTAGNLMRGTPGELGQHPVMTGLDLLPFAVKGGEAAATAKFGEEEVARAAKGEGSLIPSGSPWEALASGNPLKAATRKLGVTGGEDAIATKAARNMGVSSDIREAAGYQAQTLREGAISERFKSIRDGYKTLAQRSYLRLQQIEDRIQLAKDTEGYKPTGIMYDELAKAKEEFKQASKDVQRVGSADFIDHMWQEHATPRDQLINQYKSQGMGNREAAIHVDGNFVDLFDWAGRWSVDSRFKKWITDGNPDALRGQMVPKYMTDALDRLNRVGSGNILAKGWRGTTNVFKYAVLTGPRHVVHVLFSNGMFMALDSMRAFSPDVWKGAWDMVRGDPAAWPEGLQRGVGIFGRDITSEVRNLDSAMLDRLGFTPEQIHELAQGKTMGRMIVDYAKESKLANKTPLALFNPFAYRRFEEFATDMSRAMEFLHGQKLDLKDNPEIAQAETDLKAAQSELAPGQTSSMNVGKAKKALETAKANAEDQARAAGVKQSVSVLMDIDHMSPVERTVLRQVFPFYPFTRQLLRYMSQYPIHHPMKAAVLAAVGRIEMQDAQSGLPMKFMSLFPITGSDSQGNALFIDTKSMNPFRSMNGLSPFTRAGFLSELNPMITAGFQASGFNILTATPELYPQLTIDPVTGDLVAKPPESIVQATAEQLVPQVQTIEGMMGLSQNLASLKQSDPDAYKRLLFSNLNIPFTIGNRNISKEKIRFARNQYTVAQQDASAAVKSGDLSSLSGYKYVPYAGRLWTVDQLRKALAGNG